MDLDQFFFLDKSKGNND